MIQRYQSPIVILLSIAFLCICMIIGCAKYEEAPAAIIDNSESTKSAPMKKDKKSESGESSGLAEDVQVNAAQKGRKLIREGRLNYNVDNIEATRAKIEKTLNEAGGFISNVNFKNYTHSKSLEMTLRIPSEGYLPYIEVLKNIGELTDESHSVLDVTDQHLDLTRRITTKEKLAGRLEELIKTKSYQFKDLLEVERELARLHLEIEQLQGALNGLDARIALSTLVVTLHQKVLVRIVPPQSTFAPLINAIENAGPRFRQSVRSFMVFIGGIITLIVYLIPWLIVFLIMLGILVLIIKRSGKNKKSNK